MKRGSILLLLVLSITAHLGGHPADWVRALYRLATEKRESTTSRPFEVARPARRSCDDHRAARGSYWDTNQCWLVGPSSSGLASVAAFAARRAQMERIDPSR